MMDNPVVTFDVEFVSFDGFEYEADAVSLKHGHMYVVSHCGQTVLVVEVREPPPSHKA
jgi:hypothetical protein